MRTRYLFTVALDEKPWRPVAPPYRPRSIAAPRPRRPLSGQMWLPGMEPEARDLTAKERDDPNSGSAHREPSYLIPAVCPNCGGTTFDEDGDCTTCWEPRVIAAKSSL